MSNCWNALFAVSWYAWKTLLPLNLSPIYERPVDLYSDPFVVAGGAATVALAVLLYAFRNRWPGAWASWLCTIIVLGPTLGIVNTGGHEIFLAADRYTYLSFLGWAVLLGAVLAGWLGVSAQTRREKRRGEARRPFALRAAVAASALLLVLAVLTCQQSKIWRDTQTLWTHVLKVDSNSMIAHYNLGEFLTRRGNTTEAIAHFRKALSIRPNGSNTHLNLTFMNALWNHWALANLLAGQGKVEESEEHFQQWLYLTRNVRREPGHGKELITSEKEPGIYTLQILDATITIITRFIFSSWVWL